MLASPGIETVLRLTLSDGDEGRYPRVFVYNPSGSLDDTIDLSHVANGMYENNWTPPVNVVGLYTAVYIVYQDSGRTVISRRYDYAQESIDVVDYSENFTILRGLRHEKSLLDQIVENGDRNLETARLRVYDTKANQEAAEATSPAGGTTGLLYTFTIRATYDSARKLETYVVVPE